jgi:hypothetical protein
VGTSSPFRRKPPSPSKILTPHSDSMALACPNSNRHPLRPRITPWWLVRRNRHADAHKALLRLTRPSANPSFNPSATISMIPHTMALESQMSKGSSYLACFRGTNSRRTEIACMTWLVQTL